MKTGNASSKKSAPTVEELAEQLDVLRDDIARLAEVAAKFGQSQAERASENAGEHIHNLREKAEQEAEKLHARASNIAHEVEGLMRERPTITIALAVAFGFLVGIVSSRR